MLTPRKSIPRQPEVNIGTSGHVDHGKCLALDEYVVFNGLLLTGRELLDTVKQEGRLIKEALGGSIYALKSNTVVSVNDDLRPVEAESEVFVESYEGPIFHIKTRTGRSISVTPEHPLLVGQRGALRWTKAKDLRRGDLVAFSPFVVLPERLDLPSCLPKLQKEYDVVTYQDYERIVRFTDGLTALGALEMGDFDRLRVLAGLSKQRLSQLSGICSSTLALLFRGTMSASSRHLRLLADVFRNMKIAPLLPNEFAVSSRGRGRRCGARLRDVEIDEDMVKWFAFAWSKGTARRGRLSVSSKLKSDMLDEFLAVSRRKLGVEFERVGEGSYQLASRPLADYLNAKFGYDAGAKQAFTIAPWVLSLPPRLKATFVRWFFSLQGEFDGSSGRISIAQTNQRNIVTLAYLLCSFGIASRFSVAERPARKAAKKRYRLIVSGRSNLRLFADAIGFEGAAKQDLLLSYIHSKKAQTEESSPGLPVDPFIMKRLADDLGLRRSPSGGNVAKGGQPWLADCSSALASGLVSRRGLNLFLDSAADRLESIERSMDSLEDLPTSLRNHMKLIGVSVEKTAKEMGISGKRLTKWLSGNDRRLLRLVRLALKKMTSERLSSSKPAIRQLARLARSPLEFDPIDSIEAEGYDGYIFDLSVPGYANFVAGNGALVCHNTTLTEALTGKWTSAHSEELRRGITIRVGYADAAIYKCEGLEAPACYNTDGECAAGEARLLRVVSFVDSPGHESLMANMLSGAAVMDGAILVVAANEPVPQPQTKEHVQALKMIGVDKIVVAQNKVDLVSYEQALQNEEKITSFLESFGFKDVPLIPISAQKRLNIDALLEAIENTIPTPHRDEKAKPFMHILRSFDVNRPGTPLADIKGGVIGGSLTQGTIKVGDEIEIRPGLYDRVKARYLSVTTKVESLGTSAGLVDSVKPGGLVAVGTTLDPYYTKSDAVVGSVVGLPGALPEEITELTLKPSLFDTVVGVSEVVKVDPIKLNEILRLNIGTATTAGAVTQVKGGLVYVKLRKPVCPAPGARVAISRRVVDRWRLIGSATLV